MTTTLYENSVEPVYTDGRDIDSALAELTGEAANQRSYGSPDQHIQSIAQTWEQIPQVDHNDPTYYERPMLKEPVWEWAIPTYYYVGGLTGASLALGAAAQLGGQGRHGSWIHQRTRRTRSRYLHGRSRREQRRASLAGIAENTACALRSVCRRKRRFLFRYPRRKCRGAPDHDRVWNRGAHRGNQCWNGHGKRSVRR